MSFSKILDRMGKEPEEEQFALGFVSQISKWYSLSISHLYTFLVVDLYTSSPRQ